VSIQDQVRSSPVAKNHLSIYVNDHLAGGVAALELLAYLQRAHPDSAVAQTAKALETEISADHDLLSEIARRTDLGVHRVRQAVAWISGKATELKLKVDDPADGPLRFLEILELLSLGVEGKRSLWLSLSEVAPTIPALREIDFTRLIQRAEAQRRIIETLRLSAARAALGSEELTSGKIVSQDALVDSIPAHDEGESIHDSASDS
jgi:hypothetical protein